MNDKALCAEVARVWVDGGGDADGIIHCLHAIRRAVVEEQSARYEAEKALLLGDDVLEAQRLQVKASDE